MSGQKTGTFGYYINLDERGIFDADVRDEGMNTVFEIRCEGEDQWIFEDGWMAHQMDIDGLTSYLEDLGIIAKGAEVLMSSEFEARLEADEPEEDLELDF